MLNNGHKKECGFADEIVAYIYDEIGQTERTKFESHLANCSACTDEFAGISNARFSIFEYQKEEFAHLATPEIVIPYAPKSHEVETAGFFAGLRDMLTLSGWSSAVAVAAAVFVCIGLGFVAMNYVRSDQSIASNKIPVNIPVIAPVVTTNPQEVAEQKNPEATTPSNKSVDGGIRPVRAAVVSQHRVFQRNLTADTKTRVDPSPTQKNLKAPVLSNYDEDDDKSLRLADLVDDGGV